ncbi:MAG TPA: MBL fold metallo-hydrolase [candidate division Zixibacteria bacterium]|nr:MBL fold metallo-hydrolase [candidate division Zixibacteria bacterium]
MPSPDEYQHLFPEPLKPRSKGVSLLFIGTNSLLFRDSKTAIFVDPYFTRPGPILGLQYFLKTVAPNQQIIHKALDRIGIAKANAVLLTHTHIDHALDAPDVAKLTGAKIFGSRSAVNVGKGGGVPEDFLCEVEIGKPYKIGTFRVTFFESEHLPFPKIVEPLINYKEEIDEPLVPPVRMAEFREGGTFKILIEHKLGSFLVSGGGLDTNPPPISATAISITIAGLALRSKEYREKLFRKSVIDTGAHRVFLTHWDDFGKPLDEPPDFLGRAHLVVDHFIEMAKSSEVELFLPPLWSETLLFPQGKRGIFQKIRDLFRR